MQPPIEAVVFDLGGVLMDFAGVQTLRALADIDNDDEVWRRWLTCPWVRRFERGQCSVEDFAAGVVADWSLPIEPQVFIDLFANWLKGPLAGATELVADVRLAVPIGCLSNTNQLHWERSIGLWSAMQSFDFRFLSFELGLVKPDLELFQEVARQMDIEPGRVLFLDDNIINVDGARAAGFRAELVRGIDQARQALVAAGVLAA
jgi:FMN phosphatase YigB (HAD superfamily)